MRAAESKKTMSGDLGGYRRQQYVINGAFQWKFAATVSLVVFLGFTAMSLVLYYLFYEDVRMRSIDPSTYTREPASVILVVVLGFAFVIATGLGLWSVLLTHRICGPLFVVGRYLVDIKEGRLPQHFRPLRRKDELKDFYRLFTDAIESLRERANLEVVGLTSASCKLRAAKELHGDALENALESLATEIDALRQGAHESLDERIKRRVEPPAKPHACERVPVLAFT